MVYHWSSKRYFFLPSSRKSQYFYGMTLKLLYTWLPRRMYRTEPFVIFESLRTQFKFSYIYEKNKKNHFDWNVLDIFHFRYYAFFHKASYQKNFIFRQYAKWKYRSRCSSLYKFSRYSLLYILIKYRDFLLILIVVYSKTYI